MNKFFEYMNTEYGLDDFIYWITEWFVEQNWSLPEFFQSLPNELLKPFEINTALYRTIVLNEESKPMSTSLCSWTEDYQVALGFTRENIYIDAIEDEGDTPVFYIYKYEGIGISLNKIVEELFKFIKENNIEVDQDNLIHLETRYEKYKYEREFFAEFDLEKIKLIEKY